MSRSNLALIGFMGVGKSTIGRMLADSLGYKFCDTDLLIQQFDGRSIAAIFSEDGETAFRELERKIVAEAATCDSQVISTGGGAALDPVNISNLRRSSAIFLLIARPHEILRRIGDARHRPLLAGAPDPRAKIEELLDQRMPRYCAAADYMIITSGKHPADVCSEILDLYQPERLIRPDENE